MKYFLLQCFVLFSNLIYTQNPIKIIDVKERVEKINDSFETIIELKIEYDDNSIKKYIDTLWHYDELKFNKIKKFKYWTYKKYFYTENCYYHSDLQYCFIDSLLIYFPFSIQPENSPIKSFDDTAICLRYFYFFSQAKEEKFFELNSDNDAFRITLIGDTVMEIFAINKPKNIHLSYKKFKGFYNYFQGIFIDTLIEHKKIEIGANDFNKLENNFCNMKFMLLKPLYNILPTNVLVEGFIKGNYNFIVLNDGELKLKKYKYLKNNISLLQILVQN